MEGYKEDDEESILDQIILNAKEISEKTIEMGTEITRKIEESGLGEKLKDST